jgi:hypothetical protein
MKIVEFFLIIWGKWFELEPEFFTSWSQSRSRTKMDRLRNTDKNDACKGICYILDNTLFTWDESVAVCLTWSAAMCRSSGSWRR